MESIKVIKVSTQEEYQCALEIRREVFVREQGVPDSLEVDEHEGEAEHFLGYCDGVPAGAGRLRLKGSYVKFERIATLPRFRGRGIGRVLMRYMQAHAAKKHPRYIPFMHAQLSAVGFYEKIGWVVQGEIFEEAGIAHRAMVLGLGPR